MSFDPKASSRWTFCVNKKSFLVIVLPTTNKSIEQYFKQKNSRVNFCDESVEQHT